VRGVGRHGAQRPLNHRRNPIVVNGSRPARTSFVEQAIAAILEEAPPPLADRVFVHAELGRGRLAGASIRTSQDDAASLPPVAARLFEFNSISISLEDDGSVQAMNPSGGVAWGVRRRRVVPPLGDHVYQDAGRNCTCETSCIGY
jgi:hypothetical protein